MENFIVFGNHMGFKRGETFSCEASLVRVDIVFTLLTLTVKKFKSMDV